MCLIIYDPHEDGEPIPFDVVKAGMYQNNDMSGFVFSTVDNRLLIRKPYKDPKKLYNRYLLDLKANPKRPCIMHFRLATHGPINSRNTQPLKVSNELVMAHNGILDTGSMLTEQLSDSSLFALSMRANGLTSIDKLKGVGFPHVGWSKIIFMGRDGRVRFINDDTGTWEGKRWFSTNNPLSYGAPQKRNDSSYNCYNCQSSLGKKLWLEGSDGVSRWVCNKCIEETPLIVIRCSECSKSSTSEHKDKNGKPICYGCKEKETDKKIGYSCGTCGKWVPSSHMEYNKNDKKVCGSCYHSGHTSTGSRTTMCDICGQEKYNTSKEGGQNVCITCFNDMHKPVCSECDKSSYSLVMLSDEVSLCRECWIRRN